ncbi:hypothetical protein ID007_004310 [Salmonella enterica]|nr:hypothetical protein [Salmonella enterica]
MLTHSPFSIATYTALAGELDIPGVNEPLEVRYFTERRERPRIIVLRKSWHEAKPGTRVPLLVSIIIDEQGNKHITRQPDGELCRVMAVSDVPALALTVWEGR